VLEPLWQDQLVVIRQKAKVIDYYFFVVVVVVVVVYSSSFIIDFPSKFCLFIYLFLTIDAYAAAGGIAGQALSNIRTVLAFGGQSRELARYAAKIELAFKSGKKKALINGFGLGAMVLFLFSSYGLGFWYGGKLILNENKSSGEILGAFLSVIMGGKILSERNFPIL